MVQIQSDPPAEARADMFTALRAGHIGVNVHYVPVHLHPFYRRQFGTGPGLCPIAEAAFSRILSLPLFPEMSDADVDEVIAAMSRSACRLSERQVPAAGRLVQA